MPVAPYVAPLARRDSRTEPRLVRGIIIALAVVFLTVFVVLPLVLVFSQAFSRGVGAYFVRRAQAHGLIVRVLGGDVIAFSPPLIISETEIDFMLERAERALSDTLSWVREGA